MQLPRYLARNQAFTRPSTGSDGRGGLGVVKRILGVAILSVAIASCASVGPEPEPEPEPSSGFGSEGMEPTRPAARPAPAPARIDLETIYFEFDDSSLRPDSKAALRASAGTLKQNPNIRIEVQGNCDERGSNEYNLALGNRRAESARRYLIDLGINSSRLSTVSYGEERPAVRGSNEVAWARNRRDEFVIR